METLFSIDIEIWLPSAFPAQAPIVFAVPTFNQRLRASPLVDPTGRVSLPYVYFWHTRPNASLLEMMNYLHQAFCVEPPIFLSQAQSTLAVSTQQHPTQNQSSVASVTNSKDLIALRTAVQEKLHCRLKRLQSELAMETDQILAKSELLQANERKIEKGLSSLKIEISKVEEEIDNVRAKKESLKDQIFDLKEKGSLDLNKLIVPKGPTSEQVIRAVIDEFAIQDTIYILGKALEKRKLDLSQYLRNIRELAREHFMRKALLQKIHDNSSVQT
jgi:ESCRT-I complex subunit TSG101